MKSNICFGRGMESKEDIKGVSLGVMGALQASTIFHILSWNLLRLAKTLYWKDSKSF